MVNFIFFSLLISAKKKKIHWNASLVRYPDRNILSFFSNGCIFVANKLNIGLSIVYYLLHRIRLCTLHIFQNAYYKCASAFMIIMFSHGLLCKYCPRLGGWFRVIYKNEKLCKLWAFIRVYKLRLYHSLWMNEMISSRMLVCHLRRFRCGYENIVCCYYRDFPDWEPDRVLNVGIICLN